MKNLRQQHIKYKILAVDQLFDTMNVGVKEIGQLWIQLQFKRKGDW